MSRPVFPEQGFGYFKWSLGAIALIWTVLFGGSLFWNLHLGRSQAMALAKKEALANFNKDQAFRLWGTKHGGVYVPATAETPPNPYLSHLVDRDLTLPSGKQLTLMNPAYMVRQMMSDYGKLYGIRGRITSLRPLNPGNAPDNWEIAALTAFEQGVAEVMAVDDFADGPHLRLMRPMLVQAGCLKCHGYQGHKVGDIRGGVGVNVPLAPYLDLEKEAIRATLISHLLIWLLGACALGLVYFRGTTLLTGQAEARAALHLSEERYRSLIQKVQTAILLHDGQGRLLDSNPLAQELLGLSADQLLGKALIDPGWHFLREDGSILPVAEYPVSLVLSTRQPLSSRVIGISRPDRDVVGWMLVNGEPEYDEAGEIVLVIVSFVDISERKRAEETLHRLNRELRAISNCNQTLMRAEDEPTLLNDICRIVCDEAGYRMAWVGYAENDYAMTVRPVAWAGVEDGYLEEARPTWADTEGGRCPSGTAIRNGASACIQDFTIDPSAAPWREQALQRGYRSCLALPLKDEGKTTFGVLNIYAHEPKAFTPAEIRLLEELAGDLAYGIMVLRGRLERRQAEESLRKLNEELDQRVQARTAELERKNAELEKLNKLFVGRELMMLQLKERIRKLEMRLPEGA